MRYLHRVNNAQGERTSHHVYTHALVGEWPYSLTIDVLRWSKTEAAAQKAVAEFSRRGVLRLRVVETTREAVLPSRRNR